MVLLKGAGYQKVDQPRHQVGTRDFDSGLGTQRREKEVWGEGRSHKQNYLFLEGRGNGVACTQSLHIHMI